VRYVSLFPGAGGLDLGLMRAGLVPALMIDESLHACGTLRAAVPQAQVVRADVHDYINAGAAASAAGAVLVAGQPPVLFTAARAAPCVDPESDAPQLVYRFMDVVRQARPAAFLMALPPALRHPSWGAVLGRLRRTARVMGYDASSPLLDAVAYGVPQDTSQLFVIGMPLGCKPVPSAAARARKVSAGTALHALDGLALRDVACTAGIRLSPAPVVRSSAYSGQLIAGSARVVDLRRPAPPLPADLGGGRTPVIDLDQYFYDKEPWIEAYHRHLFRDHGAQYAAIPPFARMARLTLRQCAALQGFPPDYPFRGPGMSQFRQVGHAVPPALGEAVGRAVLAGLR
jgi:DNA (cytosine-5)-methyltransferase 1